MKTKILLAGLAALALATPAQAGKYLDNAVSASSGAFYVGYANGAASLTPARQANYVMISSGAALVQSTSTASTHKFFVLNNASGAEVGSMTQGGVLAVPGGITGTASLATALAADGANCSAASFPLGVDASGAVQSCTTMASSNAGTATALAANGANCSAGQYPLGVDASGAVESCTAAGVGDAVLSPTQTFSGINTFYGLVASSAAPAVPVANAVYKELTPKAIALFNGATGALTYSVNITSMTKTTTGKYMLHFARDFASASYVGICVNGDANTNNSIVTCTDPNGGAQQDAHTCGISSLSIGAVPAFADSARIFCTFFGAQ